MPKSRRGHISRTRKKSPTRKKQSIPRIGKSHRKKTVRKSLRHLKREKTFGKKITERMRRKALKQPSPSLKHISRLITKAKNAARKGKSAKTATYMLTAAALMGAYTPYAVGVMDKGALGERRSGLHSVEDPTTMVKWHSKTIQAKPTGVPFTRSERRRYQRMVGEKKTQTKKRSRRRKYKSKRTR